MTVKNTASAIRWISGALLTVVFIVGLSACVDRPDNDLAGADTTALPDDTAGMMMDDPGGMQADPGAMQGHMAMEGDTVEVGLVDYDINMPSSVRSGTLVFRVTNRGTEEHNFEIEGQGEEHIFPQNLQPGDTETMEVDLQPGSYEAYCPVGDHRSRGMTMDLTVESSTGMD